MPHHFYYMLRSKVTVKVKFMALSFAECSKGHKRVTSSPRWLSVCRIITRMQSVCLLIYFFFQDYQATILPSNNNILTSVIVGVNIRRDIVLKNGFICCGQLWVRHMFCGRTCDELYHFTFCNDRFGIPLGSQPIRLP